MAAQETLSVKATRAARQRAECTSYCEVYEHNVVCRALEVIRQDWSSKVVFLFLQDWERA